MSQAPIPFNVPWMAPNQLAYVEAAFRGGKLAGGGRFSMRCREMLERDFGLHHVRLTPSCTAALEVAALLLDLQPGDEVIVPSFSFVSDATAFALRGARPVFADIRPDTLNLDVDAARSAVSERTRAIVAVHYGGVACDLDGLLALCHDRDLHLVEDNAHGLGATYRGRALGTFGAVGATSFHDTKNYTSGEGGALSVNDERLVERSAMICENGTDRSRFLGGQVDKYTWQDLGSSYQMPEVLAAQLVAQLEARAHIEAVRERLWQRYASGLGGWAAANEVQLPVVPDGVIQSHHLFHLLLPDERSRDAFIEHLRRAGIAAVFHFLPLHLSPMGRRLGGMPGQCPVTEDVSARLVRLPLYNGFEPSDQDRVIDTVLSFDASRARGSARSMPIS